MCLKRLEELTTELQNIDMFISSFINTSPILAWIKDFDGKFIYANSAFIEYFNLNSIDDILNKNIFPGYLLKNSQEHVQTDELAANSSHPIELIEVLNQGDNEIQFYTIKFKIDKVGIGGMALDINKKLFKLLQQFNINKQTKKSKNDKRRPVNY